MPKKRSAEARGKTGKPKRSKKPSGKASEVRLGRRGEGRDGLVVAHHGVAVLVRFEAGEDEQIWLAPDQRAVVGDRVEVFGAGLEVLPARGVLRRRDGRGRERTIAVNLDRLALVVAGEPREPPGFLDRGFVIARAAGIQPCIVVNKCDLEESRVLADRLDDIYGAEAEVLRVSAETAMGLDALDGLFAPGELGAMVGASGVGKSSLMNALISDLDLRVGALNRGSGQGRHTTTTATLHPLPGGGFLVDTAGFKDFIAVDVAAEEAAHYFPGFEVAWAEDARCRFRDCAHRTEPDCVVLAALSAGQIEPQRHRAYLSFLEELASAAPGRGADPTGALRAAKAGRTSEGD